MTFDLPTAFSLRIARREDVFSMAGVRVQTWQAAYRSILPEKFLENISVQNVAERWENKYFESRAPGVEAFIAENARNDCIGFAICGPELAQDPVFHGEIYTFYVLPQYQHQGIGLALFNSCIGHLIQALNCQTLLVWVIAENPYRRFYKKLGGMLVRQKSIEIDGNLILMVGYGWQDLRQQLESSNE